MRKDPVVNSMNARSRRDFLKIAGSAFAIGSVASLRPSLADTKLAARIEDAPAEHPLLPALRRTAKSIESLSAVEDYEAILVREELIGRKTTKSRMELKLRHKPFSAYLNYVEPNAGREVIYNEGQNDGNLQVHETGFASLVGTLSLDPTGKLAMDGNRHPVTMIGIRKMAETVLESWLTLTSRDDVKVNYYPSAKIGDLACEVYECKLTKAAAGAEFQSTRIYFDTTTGFPIRAQAYGFPEKSGDKAKLVEDYLYLNLKTNVGLKNVDFDVANSKYGY